MLGRRSILKGLVGLVAAPAIIKVAVMLSKPELAVIDASHQMGNTLIVTPLREVLKVGDVITIDGVRTWSRAGGPRDNLRSVVVTAYAVIGNTSVHIYPPLVDFGHYRTVDKLPLRRADLRRFHAAPVFA